jgi:hypothetical protein
MDISIICIQKVDFVPDGKSERVLGNKVHFLRDVTDQEKERGVRGDKITGTLFVRFPVDNINPGNKVAFQYDFLGGTRPVLTAINLVK